MGPISISYSNYKSESLMVQVPKRDFQEIWLTSNRLS